LAAAAQRDLVGLAVKIAERVTKAHLAAHAEAIQANLADALELAGTQSDVSVRLHPDDQATAEQFAAALLDAEGQRRHIRLKPDESVTRGGCVVSTADGEVDARIETQLSRIAAALLPPDRPAGAHA
jgi:flagellar assembly protein FliH